MRVRRTRDQPLSALWVWAYRSTLVLTVIGIGVCVVIQEWGTAALFAVVIGFGFLMQPEPHRRQVLGRA